MLKLPNVETLADYKKHFYDDIWKKAAKIICERHKITVTAMKRSSEGENIIFHIANTHILKIYKPFRDCFEREMAALTTMQAVPRICSPEINYSGDLDGWKYVVMSVLTGVNVKPVWATMHRTERLQIAGEVGELLKLIHERSDPALLPPAYTNWTQFICQQVIDSVEKQRRNNPNPDWLKSLPAYVSERMELLNVPEPVKFLHGDLHLGNMLFQQENGRWRISGVFDFGDAICGPAEYDFVAPGVLMFQGNRDLQRAFLSAYGYADTELNNDLRAKLMLLTILYECSNLRKYAERLNADAVNLSLEELERAIWRFAYKK